MTATKTVLTGIKPTGRPHLGNYLGMIKPALDDMRQNPGADNYLFIANIHAIGAMQNAAEMRQYSYEVAATLLACGVLETGTTMFLESDVPEISELSTYLMHVTPKGLMNRAHAYKAATDKNRENGVEDEDIGINMGLYTYPILMAADILAFGTTHVPVGKDQVQHVEFARDIAGSFNHIFGNTFTLPQHVVRENVAIVPGLDGRKMSKSYNNHLPIFENPDAILKAVKRIVTDSQPPEAQKEPEGNNVYEIYKAIATKAETEALATRFRAGGMGYGDAKKLLAERITEEFGGSYAKFEHYMSNPAEIDAILAAAAAKARSRAAPMLASVKKAIGC